MTEVGKLGKKYPVVFNRNYKEAKKTKSTKYSKEEIKEKLKDYDLIDKHSTLPKGSYFRYYTNQRGGEKFRVGGILTKNEKDYIVLVSPNHSFSWSVQKRFITKLYHRNPKEKEFKLVKKKKKNKK